LGTNLREPRIGAAHVEVARETVRGLLAREIQ
jgi:hypothetical protein